MSCRIRAAPLHPMMPEHPSAALIGLMAARHMTLLARVETLADQLRGRSLQRISRAALVAALDAIAAEART